MRSLWVPMELLSFIGDTILNPKTGGSSGKRVKGTTSTIHVYIYSHINKFCLTFTVVI